MMTSPNTKSASRVTALSRLLCPGGRERDGSSPWKGAAGLVALVSLACGASQAFAQGDGLTGTYYQWPAATASPPPPPPGSPEANPATWTVTATRIDPTVNFANVGGAPWAPTGVGPDTFTVVWTGYVLTGADSGAYTFSMTVDDGGRLWVTAPMTAGGEVQNTNQWHDQAATTYSGNVNLLPNTFYPIRFEFYQNGGNTAAQLQWSSTNMALGPIAQANLFSDANASVCTPPSALTATAGYGKANLSWTAGTGQTSYVILRGTTKGGPYPTQVATGIMTTTYTDTTAAFGQTYYYVVYGTNATGNGPYSNEASCTPLQPLVNVNPTALQVAENLGAANFTVSLISSPSGQVTVPVTSANGAELQLTGPSGSGTTINLVFPAGANGAALTQTVTVTSQNQGIEAPPPNYSVQVTFGTVTSTVPADPVNNYNSTGTDITPVTVTIVPDAPGFILNPPSISTVNGGLPVQFTVALATVPKGTVNLNLSVSDPNLATVSPLTIMNAAYNTPVTVTVTPLNANAQTTFIGPYDIVISVANTSTDPAYLGLSGLEPVSTPVSTPPLDHVWKCGLLGVEGILALGTAVLWRRRRRG